MIDIIHIIKSEKTLSQEDDLTRMCNGEHTQTRPSKFLKLEKSDKSFQDMHKEISQKFATESVSLNS